MKGFSRPLGLLILLAAAASAQTASATAPTGTLAQTPALVAAKYEVASIKPNKSGSDINVGPDPFDFSTLTEKNVPLYGLLRMVFQADTDRISGIPNWLKTERYDIEAKTDRTLALEIQKLSTREERLVVRQRMILALMEDRLQFKFHRETKEGPVYSLVVIKPGKLHEAKGDCGPMLNHLPTLEPGKGLPVPCGTMSASMSPAGIHMTGRSIPMTLLIGNFSGFTGRPVLDKTGLTGRYDFTLDFVPPQQQLEAPPGGAQGGQPAPPLPDSNGPSLFTAVQEQLGLKLESGKGPVEVFVIDHIERPSEN